ncbi:hypothetical protein XH99_00290 [Bradyrhizobium nanningense]|uniref:Uncharacterized protein n=1 Tax=Bradyrhizobium nanningense TaxID=1325118 RepID=A0A4V1L3P9_9BRAD|nr:hypothetical protein XH99_00290 [Bradyrhizobium nanningense]
MIEAVISSRIDLLNILRDLLPLFRPLTEPSPQRRDEIVPAGAPLRPGRLGHWLRRDAPSAIMAASVDSIGRLGSDRKAATPASVLSSST